MSILSLLIRLTIHGLTRGAQTAFEPLSEKTNLETERERKICAWKRRNYKRIRYETLYSSSNLFAHFNSHSSCVLNSFVFLGFSQIKYLPCRHCFRTSIKMEGKDLEFAVNGERFKVNSVDPSTTLLDFLRLHTPFKSVKLCCGEGKLFFSYFLLYCFLNKGLSFICLKQIWLSASFRQDFNCLVWLKKMCVFFSGFKVQEDVVLV